MSMPSHRRNGVNELDSQKDGIQNAMKSPKLSKKSSNFVLKVEKVFKKNLAHNVFDCKLYFETVKIKLKAILWDFVDD